MKASIQGIEIEVGDQMEVSNRMAFFNVFNDDEGQRLEMLHFRQLVLDFSNFVDVGCSYGAFSLVFSSINPKGVSYAFDGSPVAISALKQTLTLNPKLNVVADCKLVGNTNGMVSCMFDEHQSLVGGNSNQVEMFKIDTFWKDKPPLDALKIDTEGYEYNVLLGAEETIAQYKPMIFMEVHPRFIAMFHRQSIADVYLFFQKHGYTAYDEKMNQIYDYYTHLDAEKTDSNRTVWAVR